MKPLAGLKVVSVEHFAAGPYGSMHLADMGATVIKVEHSASQGDPARRMDPYLTRKNDSLAFQGWNTNKKSVVLNLKEADGRAKFLEIVSTSDAVMNNLRGDQAAKLGIDYASLKGRKKNIVCLHISAYGRDNSRATWPGYDYLMQAEAGLMDLTGDPSSDPARFGVSIIDFMTGSVGVLGLLAGVRQAERTGKGCDVDVSLFDIALHQLGYVGTWYLNEGLESTRVVRGSHLSISPVQTFTTRDGWIYIMCMTDRFWELLVDKLERDDLKADPRFYDSRRRSQHRDTLTKILDAEFSKETTAFWLSEFQGILPIAPILSVRDALENPFVHEVGMVRKVPHEARPNMRLLANPIKFDGVRLGQKPGPSFSATSDSEAPET